MTIGDRVRLMSGSPLLTVVDLLENGYVTVAWRDERGEVIEGVLPVVCLTPV